jgi:hypothetical protein
MSSAFAPKRAGPWQIRIVDYQGAPNEGQRQAQKAGHRDQPAKGSGEKSVERTLCFSGYLNQRMQAGVAGRKRVCHVTTDRMARRVYRSDFSC